MSHLKWINLVGTALELAGTLLLAGELIFFLRKGPQGEAGGSTAVILRNFYADRARRVHRRLAYAGLAAVVGGLTFQLASAVFE